MDLATILSLVQFAVSEEPAVQDMLVRLFSKGNPTPDQWQAMRDEIAAMSYEKLVPNTKLPQVS